MGPFGPPGPLASRRFPVGTVVAAGLAGMIVGIVAGFLLVLVAGELRGVDAAHPAVGSYGPLPEAADSPAVGDCLAARPSLADVTTDDEVVPCDEIHRSEVVGLVELPDLVTRPRDRAVDLFVSEACSLAFRDYSGRNPDGTTAPDLGAVVPDVDAWADGARQVWCLVDSQSEDDGIGSIRKG